MAYPLGPVETQDNYTPAATVETQKIARLDFFISSAPIYYQTRGESSWDAAEHYIPSAAGQTYFLSLDRVCWGIRIRSAVTGTPAVVVIQLIPQSELPDNQ